MKTITAQKPMAEILKYLEKSQRVHLVGCGTCATLCHTGGKAEVIEMRRALEAAGKQVTGWMVMPTACDELTRDALLQEAEAIRKADCLLAMVCSTGVQTIVFHLKEPKPVYPALNTLFLVTEDRPGHFTELCLYCGNCVLGRAAAICPIVRCAKSLFNGPCGGSSGGKCEVSKNIPCAWQMIYDRLVETGRLYELEEIAPVKDWSVGVSGGPRMVDIDAECGIVQPEAPAGSKPA
jgi:ferredoxin